MAWTLKNNFSSKVQREDSNGCNRNQPNSTPLRFFKKKKTKLEKGSNQQSQFQHIHVWLIQNYIVKVEKVYRNKSSVLTKVQKWPEEGFNMYPRFQKG